MRILAPLAAVLALWLAPAPAPAVDPAEMLDDPLLETRARDISQGLRCLVCQNQSIDDSDAQLARDLRLLVRERLVAGDSDSEVVDYVVSRYGDFVLLKPPFKGATLVLWLGPLALVLAAVAAAVVFFRRHGRRAAAPPPPAVQPLSDEERKRLERILGEDDR